MSFLRRIGSAAAAAVVATGLVLVSSASPAQAAVNCSVGGAIGQTGGSGWARCTGVTWARVTVLCEENSGSRYVANGPWVGNGGTSTARCHEYAWVVTVGAQYQ